MPFDVSALKAKPTQMTPRNVNRTGRDLGPNPWLDKAWPFNLQTSYDNAEAYEMELKGTTVTATYIKGKNKGAEYTKLTGDAADAETLIRDAAEKLGIGASVQITPAKRAGYFTVKYQGQKRKNTQKGQEAAQA